MLISLCLCYKLGETVTSGGLEEVSLCGTRPWYSLCVSSGFGGGAEFDWNLSHVLSHRVLSSCQLGRWWGLRQRSWSWSQGWGEACAGSAPTECSFPSQYWYTLSPGGDQCGPSGAGVCVCGGGAVGKGQGMGCVVWLPSEIWSASDALPCAIASNGCPFPAQMPLRV